MSTAIYKWLIVGEGNFDVNTYTKLLRQFNVSGFLVKYADAKGSAFRMNKWNEFQVADNRIISQRTLQSDQGRNDFMGVIFVVDSDEKEDLSQNYAGYSQECRSSLVNYADWQQPQEIVNTSIIRLDTLKGVGRDLPIYGLCVPASGKGCLETDLLRAYGYPVENENSYDSFADTIKEASEKWDVDRKDWWEPSKNGKARMDKFMYVALTEGFKANDLKTKLITEPQIITDIKNAMNLASSSI